MHPTAAGSRRPPSLPGTRAARGHRTRCSGLENRRVRRVHQDRLGVVLWCRRPSGGRTQVFRIESPAVYLPQPHGRCYLRGPGRDRTADLRPAEAARYRLRYKPIVGFSRPEPPSRTGYLTLPKRTGCRLPRSGWSGHPHRSWPPGTDVAGRRSAAGVCASVIRCGVEKDQRRRQSVGAGMRSWKWSREGGKRKSRPSRIGWAARASLAAASCATGPDRGSFRCRPGGRAARHRSWQSRRAG